MQSFALRTAPAPAPVASSLTHAVWRADQMGSYQAAVSATGYRMLDNELPNGGWPSATLIELLLPQPGVGEMHLLRPALAAIAHNRRIALVQPPHLPQIAAWSAWGMAPERLLWINTARTVDALWSAEQILRNGSCGALLFWQPQIRSEALRRLHLAAQGSTTFFWMLRPFSAGQNASPAPLRLGLLPAQGGVDIDFVKRRGPQRDATLYLPLQGMPAASSIPTVSNHAFMDRRASAAITSGNRSAALV